MKPPTHFDDLVRYTTLAATTAEEIGGTFEVPFLSTAATLVLSIMKCLESIRTHKDEWGKMMEQIHEILCTILKLVAPSDTKTGLPIALLHDIAKFAEALQKVLTFLNGQQRAPKMRQLFRQPQDAARLKMCKQEIQDVQEKFKIQATGSEICQISQMKQDAKEQHNDLVALLEAYPDRISSDASSMTGTLSNNSSSDSFAMLPARPKIFHGRNSELESIVAILVQDTARIAILGAGGMGKTSLATAALYDPRVEAKYSHQYFVPCDSTPTCVELVSAVADHIRVEKGPNLAKKVAQHFMQAPPCLIVLDNLETPWEISTMRPEVEEFLSLLTDIPHLGLMITMRGAERPAKVKWTHPFLAPLAPLSTSAAMQTFIDVADDTHEESEVQELLNLTGNLPLAVSLIASVASHEGCKKALSRWRSESTLMLSNGYDKGSSLDISIMLSFTSSRMTTDAQDLLSILSMLPDGLTDAELAQTKFPIMDILACKSILLRTTLAFNDAEKKLKVLVPVREYILRIHPPEDAMKLKLHQHFHELLALWNQFRIPDAGSIVPHIGKNLGNFNSVLRDGINSPNADYTFQSILSLGNFYGKTQGTYCPLLLDLSTHMEQWIEQPILGDYLIHLFENSDVLPVMDAESKITKGNQYFMNKPPLEQAKWYHALGCYYFYQESNVPNALEYLQKSVVLADSTGSPTTVGRQALCSIAQIMPLTGSILGALEYAKKAQDYAEYLGDIHAQATALFVQGRCQLMLSSYRSAQPLLECALHFLNCCGLQSGSLALSIRNHAAEIHLLKTEYKESREMQVALASSIQRSTVHQQILAKLNIALIDICTGVDSKQVRQNLDNCKLHISKLHGFLQTLVGLLADQRYAYLALRDGDYNTANMMLAQGFTLCRDVNVQEALMCLEKLADLSTEMNTIHATQGWAGIYLVLASKSKEKLATVKALHFIGQIFVAEKDDESALNLFTVALDEFTLMGIHSWRADCMVQIATILERRGQIMKSAELWNTARPLFERSSQAKGVAEVDVKLAELNQQISTEQLHQLTLLNVPLIEKKEDAAEDLAGTGRSHKNNQTKQGALI
ncbi:hypothetical protein C8J57DRAFT_1611276 [Mycena rebaudengoi]|nr:hypothetical protein C8J57DRAFT_1611276 [Mycena rebaudengoi]